MTIITILVTKSLFFLTSYPKQACTDLNRQTARIRVIPIRLKRRILPWVAMSLCGLNAIDNAGAELRIDGMNASTSLRKCSICGEEFPGERLVPGDSIRTALVDLIRSDNPSRPL